MAKHSDFPEDISNNCPLVVSIECKIYFLIIVTHDF